MTIDQLITQLEQIRAAHGGNTRVCVTRIGDCVGDEERPVVERDIAHVYTVVDLSHTLVAEILVHPDD